ncbi:MAG: hypothetical protein AB1716_17790 [Planctomycetota bacterium]
MPERARKHSVAERRSSERSALREDQFQPTIAPAIKAKKKAHVVLLLMTGLPGAAVRDPPGKARARYRNPLPALEQWLSVDLPRRFSALSRPLFQANRIFSAGG